MKQVRPVKGSHFDALHFGDTSAFTSVFPITSGNKAVKSALSAVPELIDSIFLMHGSSETYETDKDGAIPLLPTMARIAIDRTVMSRERAVMHSRHFILQALALSQGVPLASSGLRVDLDGGTIRDLSLTVNGQQPHDRVITELRGAINDSDDTDVYEVENYGTSVKQNVIAVSP
jgi:hypothetical protein